MLKKYYYLHIFTVHLVDKPNKAFYLDFLLYFMSVCSYVYMDLCSSVALAVVFCARWENEGTVRY